MATNIILNVIIQTKSKMWRSGRNIWKNFQRKLNHREFQENFKIIKHVKVYLQIAIIKVKIINSSNLYIFFICPPLYYYENLQSKCQNYSQGLLANFYRLPLVLLETMERQTHSPRIVRTAQNKTQGQLDDIHCLNNQDSDCLQKIFKEPDSSQSSSSNETIKDFNIQESPHLYLQCSSIYYLMSKIYPVHCLYLKSLFQLSLNLLNFNDFKKHFFQIKGEQGFKFDHTLYVCCPCKKALSIFNKLLSITGIQMQFQKTSLQLKKDFSDFFEKIDLVQQKFDCQSNNWQQYKKNMNQENKQEFEIAEIEDASQIKVQSKGQVQEDEISEQKQ